LGKYTYSGSELPEIPSLNFSKKPLKFRENNSMLENHFQVEEYSDFPGDFSDIPATIINSGLGIFRCQKNAEIFVNQC
jgi:hypothetical protein